jgi:uncharacterized integral membrane protein
MTRNPNSPMTVEDARRVLWLRTNPRPLGELLDEGYLTRGRLEWAAAKAHDPALKQAAQVLLDEQAAQQAQTEAAPFPVGISMEDARATIWPFRPFRDRKMGELVESLELSLKDLGYAIENAWEERVRRASIALMLLRLDQIVKEPKPPAGPLRVVSGGRSFAERRQLFLASIQGMVIGAGLASSVLLLVLGIRNQSTTQPSKPFSYFVETPTRIAALVIVLALFVGAIWLLPLLLDRFMKSLDKRIENYRKGGEGEDRVEIALRQALDGRWALFRNVVLPGRKKTDIDGVLVGPPGVWALEVKTLDGEYRNIGDEWDYRAGNQWKPAKAKPSWQADKNAIALKNLLAADGIKLYVHGAVVWANPDSRLTVENPSVAVWELDRLPDEVGNVWVEDVLAEATRNKIIRKLTQLCKRQEEAQRAN